MTIPCDRQVHEKKAQISSVLIQKSMHSELIGTGFLMMLSFHPGINAFSSIGS